MNNDIMSSETIRANIREHEQSCQKCHMRTATNRGPRCDMGLALLYTHLVALRHEQQSDMIRRLEFYKQLVEDKYAGPSEVW